VPGVDTGTIREELRPLAQPEHTEPGRSLRTSDFAVTGGWGYLAHHGATMPGSDTKDERSYTPDEEAALPTGVRAQ